jgi:hypothetical protein
MYIKSNNILSDKQKKIIDKFFYCAEDFKCYIKSLTFSVCVIKIRVLILEY